jgi:mono/diheme cytochrome c family protein
MKYLILSALILIIACGPAKWVSTTEEWTRASERFPDLERSEFDAGKKIYQKNCQTCHALKEPQNFYAAHWEKLIPPMVGKVNENDDILSEEDQQKMRSYLLGACK